MTWEDVSSPDETETEAKVKVIQEIKVSYITNVIVISIIIMIYFLLLLQL